MSRTLFLKIFLCFWLAAGVMIIALNLMLWVSTASEPNPEKRRGAFGEALNLYAESAVQVYDREGRAAFEQYAGRSRKEAGSEIDLFDNDGKPITGPSSPDTANVASEIQQTGEHISHLSTLGRLTWGRPIVGPSGKTYIFVTRLRQPYVPRQLPRTGIAITILISGIIAYFLGRYLTSPVKKLQSAVQSFAAGNLSARVTPELGKRRDELAALGREFDHMAERIQALIDSQKRLLADISHELRSPLARLSVALELARKNSNDKATPALDRIEKEAERLNKLVGQLLALTRLESGAEKIAPDTVLLEELVQQIIDDASYEAKPQNKEVIAKSLEACRVIGSPELLRSGIENVIRNAVRYTPGGGTVEVSLRWKLDTAELTVTDQGPGVPAEQHSLIFEKFGRAKGNRPGTGLGLFIARSIAEAHGGTLNIRSQPGQGATFVLELPV